MDKFPISSSYASKGRSDGLSMYDYKNRQTRQDAPPSTESSLPQPGKTRTVREIPVSRLSPAGASSARSTDCREVSQPRPARSVTNLSEALENEIVLWTLEADDTLQDALARLAWLLRDLGHPEDALLAQVSRPSTIDTFLAANPRWVWSLAGDVRTAKHCLDVVRRYMKKPGVDLWKDSNDRRKALNEGLKGVHSFDQKAASALINTAIDMLSPDTVDKVIRARDFYAKAFSKDSSVIRYLPTEYCSWDVCKKACLTDAQLICFVPNSLLADPKILAEATQFARAALRKNGGLLPYLPDTLMQKPGLVTVAVTECPLMLEYAKPEQFKWPWEYEELCESAVDGDPELIKFVHPDFLSEQMILEATEKTLTALDLVPQDRISDRLWRRVVMLFLKESAYERLGKVPDNVFREACFELLQSDQLSEDDRRDTLAGIESYVCAAKRLGAYSAGRADAVRDLVIEQLRLDPLAWWVSSTLKSEVAAALPRNSPELEILYPPQEDPPQERHDTSCCSIS
jgi:hypothetical protein